MSIDTALGKLFEFVERGAVEIEQCTARRWVGEEASKAGRRAWLQEFGTSATSLDGGEEAEGRSHFGGESCVWIVEGRTAGVGELANGWPAEIPKRDR